MAKKKVEIVDSTAIVISKPQDEREKRAAGTSRSVAEREKDLETVSELYLKGRSFRQIAEVTKTSISTVSADIKELQQRWLDSSLRNFDKAKAQELAKIDALEATYWNCWDKSQTVPMVEDGVVIKSDSGEPLTVIGDNKWLEGVKWCINKRSAMLGLDAPKVVDINVFNADEWKKKAHERLADGLKTLELFEED